MQEGQGLILMIKGAYCYIILEGYNVRELCCFL